MNKADLIEALAPRLGGRAAATAAVEAFADVVMRAVAQGGSVGISGFGTFERVERAPRTGRNPRTGQTVPIGATLSPRFRPGAYFKDVVTDPSRLPREGLAGIRVAGSGVLDGASGHGTAGGMAGTGDRDAGGGPARPAGAPASVRREAQPPSATTARSAPEPTRAEPEAPATPKVSGTPATVRAVPAGDRPAARRKGAEIPPVGRVMLGGEEITMKMISAKKAQLARVKHDSVVGSDPAASKGKKSKKSKKGKKGKKGESKAQGQG